MGHIYSLLNKTNGKRYIGQTSIDVRRRLSHHYSRVKNGSTQAIHHAIRKYGIEAFYLQTWEVADEQLDKVEMSIIKQFDTIVPNGYNRTFGSTNPPNHKGKVPWNKGIKATEEHKQKISKGNKGKIRSAEAKKRLSEGSMGKPGTRNGVIETEDTRRKKSESMKKYWENKR